MATWEAILDYLYNNKTLDQVVEEHQWGNNLPVTYYITVKENIK